MSAAAGVPLADLPVVVRRTCVWLTQWPERVADIVTLAERAHGAGMLVARREDAETFDAAEAAHLEHYIALIDSIGGAR